jgi:hypothetical protein
MYRALIGADQQLIALAPKREYDEHTAPFIGSSDRAKALFPLRVDRVRQNGQRTKKKRFSIVARESPCFSHLARLPRSQSEPFASKIKII